VAEEMADIDPVIHGKLRLAAMSLLAGVEQADFTWLREKTGATDGNLGAQMLKLEEAGYVSAEKRFVRRKPQTVYRLTVEGREALVKYVAALKRMLGGVL
jgi:DNA-binding transcriptional ArsR family regulator